jgi:Cu(I)/Ag(I) efflux system membrane fusion protein
MKRLAIAVVAGLLAGWYASTAFHHLGPSASGPREIAYYQSPMHPWVKSPQPGHCTVCGMELVPVYRDAASPEPLEANAVLLSPESIRVAGLETTPLQRAPLRRTLRVAGRFKEDASTHAVISAPVEGRIDGLGLVHGNGQVTQRQPLATVYSRTLLQTAEKYKKALGHDEPAAAAARQELEHYGLVWEQIKSIPLRQENDIYFGLLSPRTGFVVKSYVHEGQYVLAGEKLFEITDPSKLWFMFPVYERDLPLLELGQAVELETDELPGEKIRGAITHIGRLLDDRTPSVDVRVEVEDRQSRIRLKAHGAGVVQLPAPAVLALPRRALLWPGGNPRVYVETQPGTYAPREVKLGRAGDEAWELLAGLSEGDRVVTRGAMLLDGQTQMNAGAPR